MKILITGVAGFIGFSLADNLLKSNKKIEIYGLDNFDNYYSKKIKKIRILDLKNSKKFKFLQVDICNRNLLIKKLRRQKFKYVIHLAAQAGVRFSAINPKKYVNTNIFGFINLLDATLKYRPRKILYASSSSVYGDSKNLPSKEHHQLFPKNIYASSKKLNEIIANFYSKYYKLNLIGLRFFTVYGQWGRPDMFLFKLFNSFLLKKKFYLNNSGNHMRDFTYIDDVVEITKKLLFSKKTKPNHSIFNVCSNKPIKITKIINFFQNKYGGVKIKKILRNKLDVKNTHGSNKKVKKVTSFNKFTDYKSGVINSFEWYKKYKIHKIIQSVKNAN
jgi:UDP-glucuronate 4-epimerase